MRGTLVRRDAQIQQNVIRELRWDTRVDETDVGVEVDNGVVTLTGTVESYAKAVAAQQAAHQVVGVLDVANNIQVRIPGSRQRTDTELARGVRDALTWDAHVPEEHIFSTVTQGWVTLEGEVDYWSQRAEAERVVRRLHGVRGMINKIVVKAEDVEPNQLRASIEEALERRAEREAHAIDIEVDNGTVTLTGRVHSWRERRAIVGSVAHAPGVRSVDDHLRVDPY